MRTAHATGWLATASTVTIERRRQRRSADEERPAHAVRGEELTSHPAGAAGPPRRLVGREEPKSEVFDAPPCVRSLGVPLSNDRVLRASIQRTTDTVILPGSPTPLPAVDAYANAGPADARSDLYRVLVRPAPVVRRLARCGHAWSDRGRKDALDDCRPQPRCELPRSDPRP